MKGENKMADNWYVILELEFDPPVEDEQKIADKIDEKARFWSTHFNDFKMGAQYRVWHQNIPQIKKDMIGPANIRKQLAADACSIVYEPVDKLVKAIGRKGFITADELKKMAHKLNVSTDLIRKRIAKLSIKWEESNSSINYQALYDKYYKIKPDKTAFYDGLNPMLSAFNVDNLYDFLYTGTAEKNTNSLPCETLLLRAAEKKKTEFYKNDSISGTGSKLCGQCELTFKDENSKRIYDEYLLYRRCCEIFEYIKSVVEISGKLTSEQSKDTIDRLIISLGSEILAENVFIAFCEIENITYSISKANEATEKEQTNKPKTIRKFGIKNVNSIGWYDFNTPFPPGSYSSIIDLNKFVCIYFHVFLQKPVGVTETLNLMLQLYDANDNLVSDINTEINCEPSYDKFSQGIKLQGEDGSILSPGKYYAKINFADSKTFTYHFELIQKKKNSLFGLFRR